MPPHNEPLFMRAPFAHDPHRPRYHFLPPSKWMNDPNGLIYWGGEYHLFYQFNPKAAAWGGIHWGHAVSRDLVHWRDLDVALTPTPGSADEEGCWSGCAVDDGGQPMLFYTGVRRPVEVAQSQSICAALGSADLKRWTKHAANPILSAPSGLELTAFRDPNVWRVEGTWYMLVGAGLRGVGGTVLLYRSDNLLDWRYLGPLLTARDLDNGLIQTDLIQADLIRADVWECPQLLTFGERHVLLLSLLKHNGTPKTCGTVALVGRFNPHGEKRKFTIERVQTLDHGGASFYAPQALRDDRGRVLMWGWLQEGRSERAQRRAGWSGVMSLPRLIDLKGNALRLSPAPELSELRSKRLASFQGRQLELCATFEVTEGKCGLSILSLEGERRITYTPATGRLTAGRKLAQLDGANLATDLQEGVLKLEAGERLELRVFIDHSVTEVYANARFCLTTRVYQEHPGGASVQPFVEGGSRLLSFEAWSMRSIWS